MSINITDLRPEMQTLVNSDPKKYDPNANGKIDDGVELSQLLSEYGCTVPDLTSTEGEEMFTKEEQLFIRNTAEDRSIDAKVFACIGGVVATIGGIISGSGSFESLTYGLTKHGAFKKIPKAGKLEILLSAVGALGGIGLGLWTFIKGTDKIQKSYENDVKLEVKAEQTAKGAATMQERLKHEEEMRQREAALKQEELVYRERMQAATSGVTRNISTAETKARRVNRELTEAQKKINTEPTDSIK